MLMLIFLLGVCLKESAFSSIWQHSSALQDEDIQLSVNSLSVENFGNGNVLSQENNVYQFLDVSTEARLSDLFKDISFTLGSVRENIPERTNSSFPQLLKTLKLLSARTLIPGVEQICCICTYNRSSRIFDRDYYIYQLRHIII